MAELLECLICGYQTVRCGMTNHLKRSHQKQYDNWQDAFNRGVPDALTKSIGQIKYKERKK
jgi:hypothetical protein